MASPADLSLDYSPNVYPAITKPPGPEQTEKIQEYLARLEEERLKIEAFKRELPLCLELLNNAMEIYKQQLEAYRRAQGTSRPVLEEFMPMKNMETASEKASWMSCTQLWSNSSNDGKPPSAAETRTWEEKATSPKLAQQQQQQNINGGAFLPFSKDKSKDGTGAAALPELALAPVEKEDAEEKKESAGAIAVARRESESKGEGPAAAQTHRKARRCWSPDLHRRFVNALQILGGAQVATPKQIRELMKVEGLTNDEVKSHLQKYRLHTRRPIPATAAPPPPPQLVVLGGIWVPPEYAAATSAAGLYHHPPVPGPHRHYYAPPPPEIYAATPANYGQTLAAQRGGSALRAARVSASPPESGERSTESLEQEEEREEEEDGAAAAGPAGGGDGGDAGIGLTF